MSIHTIIIIFDSCRHGIYCIQVKVFSINLYDYLQYGIEIKNE